MKNRSAFKLRWIRVGLPVVLVITAMAIMTSIASPHRPTQAEKAFEAATIKSSRLGASLVYATCRAADVGEVWLGGGTKLTYASYRSPGLGRCILEGVTLKMIVGAATGRNGNTPILERDVVGGPGWTDNDRFDIEAKAENTATVTRDQLLQMLQRLLVERFKLKSHTEMRDRTGYALVVARGGSKLQDQKVKNANPGRMMAGRPGSGVLIFQNLPISAFVNHLSIGLETPLLDQTGLTGKYSFTLKWAPTQDEFPYGELKTPEDPTAPSLFTALREQLGLRLEPQKVPVQITVIDSVEKPSPN